MKKLLLLASVTLVGFAGCYKEKVYPRPYDVLTSTPWKIIDHLKADVDSGMDCRVPQELVFNKDSTGYYYYPTPCYPGSFSTLKFRWRVSPDNQNIYYTELNGEPNSTASVNMPHFSYEKLTLRGGRYTSDTRRILNGFFEPKK